MPDHAFDPTRQFVTDFQMGRVNRRQFLQILATLTSGAALAACAPQPAAQAPAASSASNAGGCATSKLEPKVLVYGGAQDIATIDPSDRSDYSMD